MSFKRTKKKLGVTAKGSAPTNQDLYKEVTAEAKRKFDKWPSFYASSWVKGEYKRRGGKYN